MPIIKEEPKEIEESEVSDVSDSESEGESEDNGEEQMDFPSLINHFFTNEDGQNIADILTDLKKSLDTHNKLIYKMLSVKTDKN